MKINATPIENVFVVDLELLGDSRGFFSRVFCKDECSKVGIETNIAQINSSYSAQKGTFRGLHYQLGSNSETKIVKVIRGALLDIVLDLRPESSTFGQSFSTELSAENRKMMYVPTGCAHGFLTLTDHTEMIYLVSKPYDPDAERTIRWDDPKFNIALPSPPSVVSEKDSNAAFFDPDWHLRFPT